MHCPNISTIFSALPDDTIVKAQQPYIVMIPIASSAYYTASSMADVRPLWAKGEQ